MMKFLSNNKEALYTITEFPSSSYTAGTSPTKPSRKETTKKNSKKKKDKKMKSIVRNSLRNALSILDAVNDDVVTLEDDDDDDTKEHKQSSQHSINTCSTAPLTDDESDMSSKDEKREAKEEKRETNPASLLRGSSRWGEQSKYLGDEHYLYANARQRRRDGPPVCPSRR